MSDPPASELVGFIDAMKPATSIRNRIQHLDEDVFNGKNCSEGHPVLGVVSWADARVADGHVRYSVASGPTIDGGNTPLGPMSDVDGQGDVVDFRLTAADQSVHIDDLMSSLHSFMAWFEIKMAKSIISALRAAMDSKGIPLSDPRPHGISDYTFAIYGHRNGEGGWQVNDGDAFGYAEVPPGAFDLRD